MATQRITFLRDATGLVREYGLSTAFVITFNQTVGAGVYAFSVQQIHSWPGSLPWLGMLIATVPVTALTLVYAWLAVAMPRTGGDYLYMTRILHPFVGWIVTWLILGTRFLVIGTLMFSDVKLWGSALTLVGLQANSQALLNIGKILAVNDNVAAWGAVVLIVTVYYFVVVLGKPFLWMIWFVFIVPVISGVMTIFLFALNPFNPPSLKAAWDAVYGAGAYQEIVTLATQSGWRPVPLSLDATMGALGVAIFALGLAPFTTAILGSEIKNPRTTFRFVMPGSAIITGIYMAILSASPHWAAGTDFMSQYDFVYYTAQLRQHLKINPGLEPTIPVFGLAFAPGLFLGPLVVLGAALSLYHVVPSIALSYPRYFVAMAFDRMLPTWLADVSERFHTPVKAISVLVLGGVLAVALRIFFVWTVGLVAFAIIVPLLWAVMGLVGIVLPYRMPRIYEVVRYSIRTATGHTVAYVAMALPGFLLGLIIFGAGNTAAWVLTGLGAYPVAYVISLIASRVSQREGGQVPVIVLPGLIALVFSGYFTLDQLMRATRSASGRQSITMTLITLAVGILVYAYYYWKNKREGVDLKYVYAEIPPE
jgi:basic amino acid/polyamine antiporter, APA family